MSNMFTLDSMREELEKQYEPIKVQLSDGSEAVLQNLLRMKKTQRDAVLEKLDELASLQQKEEAGELSQVEVLTATSDVIFGILELAVGGDKGKKLVKELDEDLLLAQEIVAKWQEATQPGEAGNSPA